MLSKSTAHDVSHCLSFHFSTVHLPISRYVYCKNSLFHPALLPSLIVIKEEASLSCLRVAPVMPEIAGPGANPGAQLKEMAAAEALFAQCDSNKGLTVNAGDGGERAMVVPRGRVEEK